MTQVNVRLFLLSAILSAVNPRPEALRSCAFSNSNSERSTTRTSPPITADDAFAATVLEELESRLSRLERRLRAVEQPVWQMGSTEDDWEICAEGPCRCLPEIKSVSCWRQDLLDLPAAQLVPKDVLKLDLGSNRLTALHRDTFLDMTQLNHFLPSGTFDGLSTLEELLLGKNRLSILPTDLFDDLVNLKYLGLEENRLKELPDDLFQTQASLQELNLGGNQLTEVTGGLLNPLEKLISLEMSNNKISRIDLSAFKGLVALKELQLGHNRLLNLPPGLFSKSSSLERLVLHANGLETLSRGVFNGLSNLTSLFLHSNHLRLLHPQLFQDTPNLRKLQLESNYLSSLPPRILDPVPYIEQLHLARNPWHCDCSASYLAMWLQRQYMARANDSEVTEDLGVWEFGAGAMCRGPGTLGGKLLLRLTFHELCEGQWASMRGLAPRIPIDLAGASDHADNPADSFSLRDSVSIF
ncbi:uncharacterized protein LOC143184188 isoform X2 [Calliopsis andreniformis]|uniref:uncharacterized protein LOC143184188 isoform X2 n=1 Tax=Calliopsis andreniformis TaxID=337506 RepID=UPI003FCD59B2